MMRVLLMFGSMRASLPANRSEAPTKCCETHKPIARLCKQGKNQKEEERGGLDPVLGHRHWQASREGTTRQNMGAQYHMAACDALSTR